MHHSFQDYTVVKYFFAELRFSHRIALHISNTRECYDWVTLWWDTWEFKLGQKPAFREVINCELFTCFDKCSPQVQTWPKRRTSLATLYHDQNAGSPWLRPLLPRYLVFHFESSKPGPSLQFYTSLSERSGSIEYWREFQNTFECSHGLGHLSKWPSHFTKEWPNGFSTSWESSICGIKLHYPGNRTQHLLLLMPVLWTTM